MSALPNAVAAQAAALDLTLGQARFALVTGFDPQSFCAKVLIQPENTATGWLPILTPLAGNRFGISFALQPGDQVVVIPQEGRIANGIIIGQIYSLAARPEGATSGEMRLTHRSGSFIRFNHDGSISLHAQKIIIDAPKMNLTGEVTLKGNLQVEGNVSDSVGKLSELRGVYNAHRHPAGDSLTGSPLSQSV